MPILLSDLWGQLWLRLCRASYFAGKMFAAQTIQMESQLCTALPRHF